MVSSTTVLGLTPVSTRVAALFKGYTNYLYLHDTDTNANLVSHDQAFQLQSTPTSIT